MDNLQNKTVMVTGGAGGLGQEFVKIMLEKGARHVAMVDLPTSQGRAQTTELESKYGKGRVVFFACDMTKMKEVEAMFKRVLDAFDTLDILVNNAGMMNEYQLEHVIGLNITSVIHSSMLGLNHMGKHKGGKGGVIVNIASIFGLSVRHCGIPIYCATKHAVVGFSHALANFYYMSGVRVLTLCPGLTFTPMVTDRIEDRVLDFTNAKVLDAVRKLPSQTADNVSNALFHLIQKAENGTTWVSEGGLQPYAVHLPHYSTRAIMSVESEKEMAKGITTS